MTLRIMRVVLLVLLLLLVVDAGGEGKAQKGKRGFQRGGAEQRKKLGSHVQFRAKKSKLDAKKAQSKPAKQSAPPEEKTEAVDNPDVVGKSTTTRRQDQWWFFVLDLGFPPKETWKGREGAISAIQKHFSLPRGSRNTIKRNLLEGLLCPLARLGKT